uniref:Uncharacterized protein n=1 Tax=Timema douglasi TaxID=61478 RepID=A0A7R8VSP8_TIMDO|nr:unnamed protein product [Timema douglasi]
MSGQFSCSCQSSAVTLSDCLNQALVRHHLKCDPSILEDQEHPDWVLCTEPSYDESAKLSQSERYRGRTLGRAILQACLPDSADKTKSDLSSHSSTSGAEETQTSLSKFRVKELDDDDDATSEEELQDATVRSVCIQTEITMNQMDKIHSRTNTLTQVPQIKPENYAKRIKIPAFRNCSKKLIFTNVCTVSIN